MKKLNKTSKFFILTAVVLALSVMLSCVAFGADSGVIKNLKNNSTEAYRAYSWNIQKIHFVKGFDGKVDEAVKGEWDVSATEDESVKAWIQIYSDASTQDEAVDVESYDVRYELFIGSENTIKVPADMSYFFAGFSNLDEVTGFENLDTSAVTSMRGMFSDCKSLEKLDLSKLNTQNVTDMSFMFAGCDKIKEIDFSNFNTEKVVSMNGMFERCKTVKTLDLSSFNVWNVIDTQNMFANCEALANLYVKGVNWVFNSIQNSEKMFWNCYSIKGKIAYDYRKLDVKYSTADYYAIDITATEEVPLQAYITDTIYVGDKRYALDYVGYYTYSQITGYESSDPEIVAVNAEGAMIARKAGRATIRTALKKEGTVTFVIDVHEYPVQPEDVSLLSQIFEVIKGWFEDFMNKIKSLFSFGM